MNPQSRNTIFVGIGAILVLALACMPIQNAAALESEILYKLQGIQNDIESLKENSENFDSEKIGIQTFEFRAVSEDILEIKNDSSLDQNDKETVSKVLDYLVAEYNIAFDKYKSQVEQYDKENPIDLKQKLVIKEMIQDFIDFKNTNEDYNKISSTDDLIKSEIKRIENEEKFQSYINKIAIKLVDSANGNKVENIYHEVAIQKIAEDENWMLVAPAIDRIKTQFSNPEIKQHLETYKEKVLYAIENLERAQRQQSEILSLTNEENQPTILDIVFSGNNEIFTPSIISEQLKDEIKSVISDSQKIVENEHSRIQEVVEEQYEQAKQNDGSQKTQLVITTEPEPEVESDPEPEADSEPESEPEPESNPPSEPKNKGIGNTNNNPNENASDTAKEKTSNEPSEPANNNASEKAKENPKSDNEKENPKSDNEKAKGKKA